MSEAKGRNFNNNSTSAAPSVGEIEGRLLVLELVALNCTGRLLKLHDAQETAELTAEILRNIEVEGRTLGLPFRDIVDAQKYAQDLLNSAQAQSDDLEDIKHASPIGKK